VKASIPDGSAHLQSKGLSNTAKTTSTASAIAQKLNSAASQASTASPPTAPVAEHKELADADSQPGTTNASATTAPELIDTSKMTEDSPDNIVLDKAGDKAKAETKLPAEDLKEIAESQEESNAIPTKNVSAKDSQEVHVDPKIVKASMPDGSASLQAKGLPDTANATSTAPTIAQKLHSAASQASTASTPTAHVAANAACQPTGAVGTVPKRKVGRPRKIIVPHPNSPQARAANAAAANAARSNNATAMESTSSTSEAAKDLTSLANSG